MSKEHNIAGLNAIRDITQAVRAINNSDYKPARKNIADTIKSLKILLNAIPKK